MNYRKSSGRFFGGPFNGDRVPVELTGSATVVALGLDRRGILHPYRAYWWADHRLSVTWVHFFANEYEAGDVVNAVCRWNLGERP